MARRRKRKITDTTIVDRSAILFLLIALCMFVVACKSDRHGEGDRSYILPDSIRETLQDADIICRLGDSWYSGYMSKIASKEKRYSHIGIIARSEDGSCVVYHSEDDEQAKHKGVIAESLTSFLSRAKRAGVYRLNIDCTQRNKILSAAQGYVDRHTPFDFDFDASNDDALYCTEFVVRVMTQAGIRPRACPTGKVGMVFFYSIDDIVSAANPIWHD